MPPSEWFSRRRIANARTSRGAGSGGGIGAGLPGIGGRAGVTAQTRGPGGGPIGTGAGAPIGGHGRGDGGEERERDVWLTEDDDIWGADEDVAPPLIG
jgi:hypothetical protein